jgi:predicted hotdog family 3-hydroxylacyl-ACP dehydratase
LYASRLDTINLPLRIFATRLFGDRANSVYECLVSAAQVVVAEVRIIIVERA